MLYKVLLKAKGCALDIVPNTCNNYFNTEYNKMTIDLCKVLFNHVWCSLFEFYFSLLFLISIRHLNIKVICTRRLMVCESKKKNSIVFDWHWHKKENKIKYQAPHISNVNFILYENKQNISTIAKVLRETFITFSVYSYNNCHVLFL